MFNFSVTHKELPYDLGTANVHAVFVKNERMIEIHAAGAGTVSPNIARNNFIPLHGGAVSWYRSRVTPGVVQSD